MPDDPQGSALNLADALPCYFKVAAYLLEGVAVPIDNAETQAQYLGSSSQAQRALFVVVLELEKNLAYYLSPRVFQEVIVFLPMPAENGTHELFFRI
jgi:hypothetical protein